MSAPASRPRPLVAGNWKMNGLKAGLAEAKTIIAKLAEPGFAPGADAMICPPATLITELAALAKGTRLQTGGQDCHTAASGAHTGDISAQMLADAGACAVIVGHSERRADHAESSALVRKKAEAALGAGLIPIICIGETAGERQAGLTLQVVRRQLEDSLPKGSTPANTVIAYEPVWAIGTGLTPTAADIAEVHAAIRASLLKHLGEGATALRLLYGGSVKASNARELMSVANVDGALVGGASLKAADFLGIFPEAYKT